MGSHLNLNGLNRVLLSYSTHRKARGVDDIYNSFFAGNVAGMVGALKGRNPRRIVFQGIFVLTLLHVSSLSNFNVDNYRAC